ncbi:MAG: aminotransferase class IV [Dongiaceae bacterium]
MSTVFLNGALVNSGAARIDPADRGLLLGDGLFETLRAYGGALFRLDAHLARLAAGAAAIAIPLPMAVAALADAVSATLRANGLTDAGLRITLTRGPGPRGLAPPPEPRPTLLITAVPYAGEGDTGAVRACLAGAPRNEHSPSATLKTLGYLDNVLAAAEARARGCDEAILRNTAGRLAGGARGNLFVVAGGALLTPPPREGALPGIARATVLELARGRGIEVRETPIDTAALAAAAEAFLTNSLIEVLPLGSIDGRPVGDGGVGPLTAALRAGYRKLAAAKRL